MNKSKDISLIYHLHVTVDTNRAAFEGFNLQKQATEFRIEKNIN